MVFKVHGFVGDVKVLHQRMDHLPRCGDTLRFAGDQFSRVVEVIWCMDEQYCTPTFEGQRINLIMDKINSDETK